MQVGEMGEFHWWNSKGGWREGKGGDRAIDNALISIHYSATMATPSRSSPRRTPATAPGDATAIVVGLRRIVRALELYSADVRRDYGLTAPQLWALKTLARTGPVTTGELAQALLVHQSSTSLLVARLERRGLVRRTRQRHDRRFVRIDLTERGQALAAEAPEPAQGRLLHGLGAMPAGRIRGIRRAVDDLVAAMEAEGVEARFFFADG
jgi:DNA-binding MarR family transcriptional regulator